MTTPPAPADGASAPQRDLGGVARWARAKLARRWLSQFVRQAIDAGVVHGIRRVEWGPHLEAVCLHTQLQLEGWLVAHGPDRDSDEWTEWASRHAAMLERQRAAWMRTGATWEDSQPEPWLRYVLVQNQLYNLPPSTLKSTIVMICACAWIWLHAPTFIFGASSGVDANVSRDSNATRDIIRSQWYRETFQLSWDTYDLKDPNLAESNEEVEIKLRPDADSVSDWATTAGGRRYSRTWHRGFTGLHVDGLFGDDPDDADRVHSESTRLATQNKWTNAMETRVNDEHRSIRLVMQQVVHAEGMSAYLLSIARWSPQNPKGWSQLCIAAEFGFGPPDAPTETPFGWRDWRTQKGDTMHPRLSAGVLADKRLKMPGYEGQFNQNADRHTDGIFQRRHARFFVLEGTNIAVLRRRPDSCPPRIDDPPVVVRLSDLDRITLSVDAANSLDPKPGAKVSAVGLIVGACRGEERYVLDDRTRVLGVSGTYQAVFELIATWALDRILVEMKALGAGVVRELQLAIRRGWYINDQDEQVALLGPDGKPPRCEVETYSPGTDTKVQRAHGMLPSWQRGLLFMLDGAHWLYPQVDDNRKTLDEGFIGEVCSFPGSRRNDRVDALSQFVAHHSEEQDPVDRWRAMARMGRR